jgi:hypothetical protein
MYILLPCDLHNSAFYNRCHVVIVYTSVVIPEYQWYDQHFPLLGVHSDENSYRAPTNLNTVCTLVICCCTGIACPWGVMVVVCAPHIILPFYYIRRKRVILSIFNILQNLFIWNNGVRNSKLRASVWVNYVVVTARHCNCEILLS